MGVCVGEGKTSLITFPSGETGSPSYRFTALGSPKRVIKWKFATSKMTWFRPTVPSCQ